AVGGRARRLLRSGGAAALRAWAPSLRLWAARRLRRRWAPALRAWIHARTAPRPLPAPAQPARCLGGAERPRSPAVAKRRRKERGSGHEPRLGPDPPRVPRLLRPPHG